MKKNMKIIDYSNISNSNNTNAFIYDNASIRNVTIDHIYYYFRKYLPGEQSKARGKKKIIK